MRRVEAKQSHYLGLPVTITLTMEEELGSYQGQSLHLARDPIFSKAYLVLGHGIIVPSPAPPVSLFLLHHCHWHTTCPRIYNLTAKKQKPLTIIWLSKHFLLPFILFKEKLLKRVIFNHCLYFVFTSHFTFFLQTLIQTMDGPTQNQPGTSINSPCS